MKKLTLWLLSFIITIGAAYYQRKTGPTYPKRVDVAINDSIHQLSLVRSLGLDRRPEVRLRISDTTVKAKIYFKRFRTGDEYETRDFEYNVYPVNSQVMNKIFRITEEKGLYAEIPKQPPAGKIEYYIEITDSQGTRTLLKDNPLVIRFKGSVPGYVLVPHVILMFLAMLLSTLTGLMSITRYPSYKKYALWTLILLVTGGMILGPLVQKFAFGELWTGVPFGWDLTDNKTLIATLFWIIAVIMNRKKARPVFAIIAAIVLLIVYSIPHSLFGSELDYASGQVIQGLPVFFFCKKI
jgi:hypothetical protein